MWQYQAGGGFGYILYIVDDDEVYFPIFVFNFPFDFSFTTDLYHPSVSLLQLYLYWSEWDHELVHIVGHTRGGIIVNSNE